MKIGIKTKSAFTLVELIIVTVIISILGTLAFLSFGQKSSYARDTLRKYDLGIINKIIGTRLNEGKLQASDFINTPSLNHTFSTGSVYKTPITNTTYRVGTPNKAVFGYESISDPITGNPYIIGFTQGEFGTYYQVSATLETQKAIVEGAYYVSEAGDLKGIIKDPSGTGAILDNGDITPY